MKVINAGYPKSGTKSLAQALRILGYDEVYDHVEAMDFGFDEWEKILNNESSDFDELIDKVYANGVEAVIDLPHTFFFEKFLRRWPDAKVVLTVRDEEKQYESYRNSINDGVKKHLMFKLLAYVFSPTARRYFRWVQGLSSTTMAELIASRLKWIELLRRQHAYVKAVVPEDQLLVFDVREGWEPLCKFLGKPIPQEKFPFENKRGEKGSITEAVKKSKVITQATYEVKIGVFVTSLVLCLIAVSVKKFM